MKIPKGFKKLDIAEYLKTEDEIQGFLDACLEDAGDDPKFITHALGIAARARSMTSVSKKSGLTRTSLYKSLSGNTNPSLDTFLKVVKALGFKIQLAKA